MKKIILKSFISSFVFFGTWILIFIVVKAAWNWLQSSPGDKLTSSKRNQLVNAVEILSGSQQFSNTSVLSISSTSFVDTDMVITTNIVGTRALLITAFPIRWTAWYTVIWTFSIDWADVWWSNGINWHIELANGRWSSFSMTWLATGLTPWSHTFKVRCKVNWSTGYIWASWVSKTFQVIPMP